MVRRDWSGVRRKCSIAFLGGLMTFGAATLGMTSPAGAQTEEAPGAFGYQSSFTLFGGGPFVFGPIPTVTLPEGGSATPITATVPTGDVRQGPGILFTSGPITVSTEGSAGSVTSSASITDVPTEEVAGEILYAGKIDATCTGSTGSVTIAGPGDAGNSSATLRTSDGNPDIDGDEVYEAIPLNPPPNLTINGTLESVDDTYKVVFNEQIINADGSLTINAVHEFLLGPTAVGDVYIGQVRCGAGDAPETTTTTAPTTNTTAAPTGGSTGGGSTTGGSTTGGTGAMATTCTDTWPLTFLGLELVLAGGLAIRWAARRRAWPR
ncbi:MAG: hypothetical protein ACR2HV_03650 [Acidimicrobiales bacterium]